MPTTYGEELAEAKIATMERTEGRWTEEECRSWIAVNDPDNLATFNLLLEEARNHDISFVGSVRREKAVPAGSLRITLDEVGITGHIYVYHYSAASTSIELSFTTVRKAAGSDMLKNRLDNLLRQLGDINELQRAAIILRESNWKRRPNVPLQKLPTASVKRLVEAIAEFRSM